jgi:hypothetical protein
MAMTNYSSYFKNNSKAYNTSYKDTLGAEAIATYCEQIDGPMYSKTNYKVKAYKNSKNKYSEYRNVKKVNSHIIDIVDILEQKENRTSKKLYSLNETINDNGDEYGVFIKSYYPTPEEELLNKLSRFYSRRTANKIRNDKKYVRFVELSNKNLRGERLKNKDVDFMYNFKKRNNLLELSSKEVFYIVNNY